MKEPPLMVMRVIPGLAPPLGGTDEWPELYFVATFCGARLVALELHERAHALVARLLGFAPGARSLFESETKVPGVSACEASQAVIRHSGWLASVALATRQC